MENPQIKMINCDNNQEVTRKMDVNELAQLEIDARNAQAEKQAESQKAVEKAALLAKLGITADEAQLLLS